MPTARDSIEIMSAKQFANINQQPKFNPQKDEHRNSLRSTQRLSRDFSEYNSTRSTSRKHSNGRKTSQKETTPQRQQGSAVSSHNPGRADNKKSPSLPRRMYRWCAQCCGRKKSRIQRRRQRKRNCFKRLRDKCRRRKPKKKTSFKEESTTIPIQQEDPVTETLTAKRATIEKIHAIEDLIENETKRESVSTGVSAMSIATSPVEGTIIGLTPDLDFTKSCCFLCAKNTMAIAAAMANNIEKLDISVQASTKEMFTSDKSCSPSIKVRTVQSSVKVKMRDISTAYQDEKKDKRILPKFKLKRLNDMLPKFKLPMFPKTRTVACETDKSIRCNNIPQCRAKRRTHCVTEANAKQNNVTHTEPE